MWLDDLMIASDDLKELAAVKKQLSLAGVLRCGIWGRCVSVFLSIDVVRAQYSAGEMKRSHKRYALDVVENS